MTCNSRRQQDEWLCGDCGMRWDVGEVRPVCPKYTADTGKPSLPSPQCDHDWHCAGYVGMCVVYRCYLCGDEYEKDVS